MLAENKKTVNLLDEMPEKQRPVPEPKKPVPSVQVTENNSKHRFPTF